MKKKVEKKNNNTAILSNDLTFTDAPIVVDKRGRIRLRYKN
jgi:hypothetical protein